MKILHYSFGLPPKATGGLPLYVQDLVNAQKKLGYEVDILLPKQKLFGKDRIYKSKNIFYLDNSLPVASIFGIKNPKDFMRKYNKNIIVNFFNIVKPDIIHIHTLMGLPKEFLEIAKQMKIKLIYTTHDYYGLCLKCNFVDNNGNICNSASEKCSRCNLANGLSKEMDYLISTPFYKYLKKITIINKLKTLYREKNVKKGVEINTQEINVSLEDIGEFKNLNLYYQEMFSIIDKFHFNSTLAQSIFMKNNENLKGTVIPITLSHIVDNRKSRKLLLKDNVVIGYIGRKEPYKGVDWLLENLKLLHQSGYDFKCLLYGDNFDKYDGLYDNKIINKGMYKSSQLEKVFNSIDVLVVPSIWYETFGLVVLEALYNGVPVLVSENVGSKDIIHQIDQTFIFNENTLFSILEKIIVDSTILDDYSNKIKNFKILSEIKKHAVEIVEMYQL